MISSPNRHSPIGIAARRFGGFSAGALTAMTSVYCRRCTELAQLHLWRRPFRHLKSENEHCVIPYLLTKLPSSAFGNSTCHMPPVDSAADARAGAGRRGRPPALLRRHRAPVPNRFVSTGGGAPSDPAPCPARGRAGDDTSETGRGWFGVGHAMPMVHAWNHYCAVTAVFSVHHT